MLLQVSNKLADDIHHPWLIISDSTSIDEGDWSPIPALWDSIQYFVDNYLYMDERDSAVGQDLTRTRMSSTVIYAVNGIILLSKIHTHFPCVKRISTEDLLLMGFYCLNLHDLFKCHDFFTQYYPELAEAIIELAHAAVESLKEHCSDDAHQVWRELDVMLDLLLEVLCGLLIDMVGSLIVSDIPSRQYIPSYLYSLSLTDKRLGRLEGTPQISRHFRSPLLNSAVPNNNYDRVQNHYASGTLTPPSIIPINVDGGRGQRKCN